MIQTREPVEEVPCKWCGAPTAMIESEMCDRCWELDRRITNETRPIVLRMLAELDEEPSK